MASKAPKKSGGGSGEPRGDEARRRDDEDGGHGNQQALENFLALDEKLRALEDLNRFDKDGAKNLAGAGRAGKIPGLVLPTPTPIPSAAPRPDFGVISVRRAQDRPGEPVF